MAINTLAQLTAQQTAAQNQAMSGLGSGPAYPGHLAGIAAATVPEPPATEPRFKIEKINNGYVVHFSRYAFGQERQHFCESIKAIGEFVTAMCVKYELEGSK